MNENTNLIDEHNENLIPVKTLSPFKRMVLSIGTLPSAFYDTMTYYEALVWLYKYLNDTVIPTINNNGEAVEELQEAFITLETFINEYFDNLDVQEEINNKLDAMALDGSLTELIKGYVDPIYEAYEVEIEGIIDTRMDAQDLEISNFKTSVNSEIATIDGKVTAVTSGSPLVAANTSGMTDTSRIYVNTTDGKWYYYDGDSWEIGGTYQSTGIDAKSIIVSSLCDKLKTDIYETVNTEDLIWTNSSIYQGSEGYSSNVLTSPYVYLVKDSSITFGNSVQSRITQYSDTKIYISNTGSFTARASYTIPADGWYRICIKVGEDAYPPQNATNSVCSFTGFVKAIENFNDNLTYSLGTIDTQGGVISSTTRIISNQFYAEQGTSIQLKDIYSSGYYQYAIDKYNLYGDYLGSIEWSSNPYTTDNNYLLRLRIYRQNTTIDSTVVNRLAGVLQINLKENVNSLFPILNKTRNATYKNSNIFDLSAHRGYVGNDIPENSIYAYKYAKNQGFDRIECDVRFTSDNVAVICHDESINRVARNNDGTEISGTVNVASSTYSQLQNYDFGIAYGSMYAGTRIMTFDNVCKFAKYYNIKLNLDIKDYSNSQLEIIYSYLQKYGLYGDNVKYTIPANDAPATKILTLDPKAYIALGRYEVNENLLNMIISYRTNYPNAKIIGDTYIGSMTNDLLTIIKNNSIEMNYFLENNTTQLITGVNDGAIGFTLNNTVPYEYLENNFSLN